MAEDVVEDVRFLQVVQLIRLPDELTRDEAAVGQVVEEDVLGHQSGHADHGPAGQGLQLGVHHLEVGDAAGVQVQRVQPAHIGVAGPARQDLHLPGIEGVPGLVLDLGIGVPVLGDGPVGGGAFRRGLKDVFEIGHGNAPLGSDGRCGQISALSGRRHARLLQPLRTRRVTTLSVDSEPFALVLWRQGFDLRRRLQSLLGGIGDDAALRVGDEDAIEGLIAGDHARLCGRACVSGVHIHDQAVEGVVAMPDDLSEAEPGCVNLGHASSLRLAG
ncbi:hypothetical protein D3C80_1232530 [compost metagenome]